MNWVRCDAGRYGTYTCTASGLDLMMVRHLPASINDLRGKLAERAPEIDWSDIDSVTAALVILGEWEGV